MNLNRTTSNCPTAPRTSASAGAAVRWLWDVAHRPAFLQTPAGLLPVGGRVLLERQVRLACGALQELTGRSVRWNWRIGAGGVGAAFGLVFRDGDGATAIVTLDLPLARAIADALSADVARLRGAGELTEAEKGLLDLAGLHVVDRLSLQGGGLGDWSLEDFADSAELPSLCAGLSTQPMVLDAAFAGRGGRAALSLTAGAAAALGACVQGASDETVTAVGEANGPLAARVVLPPMAMSRAELSAMRAGDVVTLGIGGLENLSARLATPTGWSLAGGVLRRAGAMWSFEAGDASLEILPGCERPAPAEHEWVHAALGNVALDWGAFEGLMSAPAGRRIDFPMEPHAGAQLCVGTRCAAWGELVEVDGELGIRFLECTSSEEGTGHAK